MATETTYIDSEGKEQKGYFVDGKTYKDQNATQRVDVGSIVDTAGGVYRLTDSGGVKIGEAGGLSDSLHRQSGTVSSTSGSSGSSDTSASLPAASDYSSYLNDLYSAKEEASLAALEEAYQNNVATLDAAETKLDPAYQTAKNQTAAASEQEKRNFGEYAAASGLNTGASGQAELARSVTLQNNLNDLNQAQVDAHADLELQRTRASNEYQAAIASAKAEGDYQLAAALYQESVRVDEALRNTALSQASLDYQKYQTDLAAQQYEQSRADSLAAQAKSTTQTAQQNLASYGYLFLQNGVMPSDDMLAAMDISKVAAQSFLNAVKRRY